MNKSDKFYFTAKVDTADLNLSLYGPIGCDMFGEGVTAANVADAISNAGEFSSVTLNINSPGGDLFQGVAIYNALKAIGKPVAVNVVGLAASAASLIAMAGDTITMQLGTQMMLHEAMAMAAGYATDMRKMADTLESVTNSAADIYVAKTGLTKEAVLKLMAAETWYGPEDAVKNGFATNVSKQAKAAVANSFDLSVYKNTPVELAVKTKEVDGENLTSEDFIWVGNPHDTSTWALPWHFSTEEKTKSHLRDALARFDQEEKIPANQKPEAHAKLVRIAKEHGIDAQPTNATEPFDALPILKKRIDLARRK